MDRCIDTNITRGGPFDGIKRVINLLANRNVNTTQISIRHQPPAQINCHAVILYRIVYENLLPVENDEEQEAIKFS